MKVKLTILGTGTFFVSKDQSASAYLIEANKKKILVDCGPGTLMRLSQIRVKPQDLDYIFITHFHPDHTSDLFPLVMNLRLNDFFSINKLLKYPQIYGPTGIYNFLLSISKISELPALDNWNEIKYTNIKSTQKIGNIEVKAFKVKHMPFGFSAQSYAYRFKFGNKIITFSGDCTGCPGVEKSCINADVFVCDTSYPKGKGNVAHMDTKYIGEIAQKGCVKKIILIHLYPQYADINLAGEIKESFSGEIVKGKDLLEINL